MNVLIVFYSRTGITKKLGTSIHNLIQSEVEEIIDQKPRSGPVGYVIAGKDATLKKETRIKEPTKNPKDYDLVIIGTPVWAYSMTPAIRTYIKHHLTPKNRLAFFCTQSSNGAKKTFEDMALLSKQEPIAKVSLLTEEITHGGYLEKVQHFIEEIKKSL